MAGASPSPGADVAQMSAVPAHRLSSPVAPHGETLTSTSAAQHQIMHEPSEVYGEGFRRAYAAFMGSPGLTALLGFVRRSGQFPPVTPSPG